MRAEERYKPGDLRSEIAACVNSLEELCKNELPVRGNPYRADFLARLQKQSETARALIMWPVRGHECQDIRGRLIKLYRLSQQLIEGANAIDQMSASVFRPALAGEVH